MSQPPKISYKNLPTRPMGLFHFLFMWLLLDRLQSPGWVWGVCFTILALCAVASWTLWWKEDTKFIDVSKLPFKGGTP